MTRFLCLLLALFATAPAFASISSTPTRDALALIRDGHALPILADPGDDPGVLRAARDLQADFGRVAGREPEWLAIGAAAPGAIIVGTIGRSKLIDTLIADGRLDASGAAGQWEAFVQQVVDRPAPGIGRALVIAGADRRGAIYGTYDLSRAIGVSPWYWWADVPVRRQAALYVSPERRIDQPKVKYRGIFINDEDPALLGWVRSTYGDFNHAFYDRVFELILRLKGNMLWPAMWGKSFYEDDPENGRLADARGIVIATSHHEPLMRAHVDWERHGQGPWDYTKNEERLRQFWREGLERTQGYEKIVTVGMRGDGDEPMTEGTAIPLLERIVADQRRIIADVTGRPPEQTPQVWALYKEVQDYYDKGMRVPDDVTLLFSDDNWGNIRRLPKPGETRPGGYGVYYHFDYVGAPRNYKWINTTQIARVWEQMHLAYAHGADRLWMVNVGDIKPMEYPISFFLDYAWNPDAIPLERLADYPRGWAAEQFGEAHAAEIGALLTRYALYAARRKPELLNADTYSLGQFGEAQRVIADWDELEMRASALSDKLPAASRDAYFELVLHPIMANANLHRLYVATARARRGEAGAADEARRLFARDGEIRRIYEQDVAGGKWTQMMAQTHIGYTSWQQPERDAMPDLSVKEAPRATTPAIPDHVVIEAPHFTRAVGGNGIAWQIVPDLGLTGDAVAAFPVTAAPQTPGGHAPHLEYAIDLARAGEIDVQVTLSPTLDFTGQGGLRFALSIDDGPPRIVNVNGDVSDAEWSRAVADNRWLRSARFTVDRPGEHVVRLWLVDPGLVFQRVVVTTGPLPYSYLGPPETARR